MLNHPGPSAILNRVATVQRRLEKFKLSCPVEYDRLMSDFTTFRVGGPADAVAYPRSVEELRETVLAARAAEIPAIVFGGGANVVVSDAGIRGLVVHLGQLRRVSAAGELLRAEAGAQISDVAAQAANRELSGLEFIFAMPGSVGGAVWMNARCYGGEIAPILHGVEYLTRDGETGRYEPRDGDFAYKKSPFQTGDRIITAAEFRLRPAPGQRPAMWERMRGYEEDRRLKGHFAWPCAGSVFKNDRRFGQPSGKIIDDIGLRGLKRGAAMVSDRHGNIIINTGAATAADIRSLVEDVQDRVARATGYHLEPEILFVGEWP